MSELNFSPVELAFFQQSGIKSISTHIPYILVDNFPRLGMLTAMRFLEWVTENPEGVISLPTGKTPEHFIKWTKYFIENHSSKQVSEICEKYNFKITPDLRGLRFVQIDEFYPIQSRQTNSFFNFVKKFYINELGLSSKKALLINCDEIRLVENKHFLEIFPDSKVDLTLRYRSARNLAESRQQQSIFIVDNWCTAYEQKIRSQGGIGFFLGGIGPDGHIAFNTRGADHFSTTRLTTTNFETQAIAAGDLGGIAISRNRLVITIGLETITHNPDATAIIFAAGEAKAEMVKNALENKPDCIYPATALQKLPNSRFYLTRGAAVRLNDQQRAYYQTGEWTQEKTDRAVISLCKNLDKFGSRLELSDMQEDEFCRQIPGLSEQTVDSVMQSIHAKIDRGIENETNQVYFHTGPHHDDLMLGIMPYINRQLRSATNKFQFAILTSGFTAVTNQFIVNVLKDTAQFIDAEQIQMIKYPDFFETGYKYKWDKDVYHYLNKVASGDQTERRRGLCHRVVRAMTEIYQLKSAQILRETIFNVITVLTNSYDGEKNTPDIQRLKGMIREFEEELVWAHFGVRVENVHHMRLGFYKGDIFTEQPDRSRDVMPIVQMLKKVRPTVISLALDPEGSGPDTHYKVLQAIAEAVRIWGAEEDITNLRIWGYRNVWYKFHPSEVEKIIPVSLNALNVLNQSFTDCYLSQVEAAFPSYAYDGKFSELTQKVWVEQLKEIQLLLGKDFFYQNLHPIIRATHGLLYLREMKVADFLEQARALEFSMEAKLM